jgi:hypothetical protein
MNRRIAMAVREVNSANWSTAITRWSAIGVFVLVAYVLSSGPVLATCFWLRELTGIDSFYAVMWLYAPILILGHNNLVMWYIEWWVVDVFHTVGPG